MLVGNGTGGYLLAQATGGLKANVSRAVLEGSLHKSVVPWNTARALLEEYVRPKAEASGNASTPEALFKFTIKYLTGDDPLVTSLVEQQLKGGDEETKLVLLAQAVSGCATRSAARSTSRGYHYVVDGGAQPLFEPVLSTAAVAQYLSEG
ncbi:hypothetical protein V5799_003336 [Amblyomma americanum]|uniref:Uncharacterized protein n=1 Tax=Amblyomma americanum TaxID=6943 RepID=A0AAQ4D991_AMBAM